MLSDREPSSHWPHCYGLAMHPSLARLLLFVLATMVFALDATIVEAEEPPEGLPQGELPDDEPVPDLPVVEASVDPVLELLVNAANPRLSDQDGQRFFDALVARGSSALPSLAKLFRNPQSSDRENWVAARAIGRIGGEGARRSLEAGLESPRVITRLGAIAGLQNIADKASVEPLERALFDQAMTVRAAAADALGALGVRRSAAALARALDLPANFHQGTSLFVRRHIVNALGDIGSISGIEVLVTTLSDSDPEVAMAALRALTQTTGMDFRGNAVLRGTPVAASDVEAWTAWWSKRRAGESSDARER
jgi:HEAT repeat protein